MDKMTEAPLQAAWKRLESLCTDLWADNSPRAVAAQALLEEYRSEMVRHDAQVLQACEGAVKSDREHEESQEALRSHYTAEIAGLKKRLELLDRLVKDKDAEISDLLTRLGEHERKNSEMHAQFIKTAAASEEAMAKKMEELYTSLKAREESLEGSWRKREQSLEEEVAKVREVLATRQAELDAWEKRRVTEEDVLKRRGTDLEIRSQQLQQEYRLKQQEIELLKASLQRSVTELVRQYQSRLKGGLEAPAR
ncbi:MAG: hypothetical protein SF051_05055 [Elusimicrobiota bacterium]|nr:hypothetical protein [Elusimicrobiota bacterium]